MTEWLDIGPEDMVEDDDVIQVVAEGSRLAVYRIEDKFHVTADRCTHQEASLAEGYLDGWTIECPRHQGVFDICTGKAMGPPLQENIRVYDVKVDSGRVLVDLSSNATV